MKKPVLIAVYLLSVSLLCLAAWGSPRRTLAVSLLLVLLGTLGLVRILKK